VQVWLVPPGFLDVAYLTATDDSPEDIARHFRWKAEHVDWHATFYADLSAVRYVRVSEPDPVRTAFAVLAPLALLLIVVIGLTRGLSIG
jgi:hypothetical protein